jgi:monoamine oxidase
VQFDKSSADLLHNVIRGTTIVSNELQKIIPIDKNKGVYMIAYSDNAHALTGRHFAEQEIVRRIQDEFQLNYPLRVLKIKHYFWSTGTHYYKPLRTPRHSFLEKIRNPQPGLYVIGEAVSTNQGWVEGALESADNLHFGQNFRNYFVE